jgi:sulfur carrier protein ThiS adenylyltransferase
MRMPSNDRDIRQRDLVPPARLAQCHAVVIGVGAIGRQVALQLAAVGVPKMTLIDHDTVAVENLAPQGFWESDIGRTKVEAVAEIAKRQFATIEITSVPERFRASSVRTWSSTKEIAVFCAVDDIETRKLIWQAVQEVASFFADGRMAAEIIRVLASGRPSADALYSKTLFPAREAYQGSCTAKSTIYSANIAAGLMVGQFARWLRGWPVVPDQLLNLVAAEYHASEPAF